jgi:hypothetical protein
MKIYVAGPITKGNISENISNGIKIGDMIANRGHYPYIPHLTFFWDMFCLGHDYEFWMNQDFEWIKSCDAVFRMDGESPGAEREVEFAKSLGKKIYYSSVLNVPLA